MDLIKSLTNYLQRKKDEAIIPDGVCPNCWGRQEYEGKFLDAVYQEGVDTNSANEKKGWIQAYAEENLMGITLKDEDQMLVCPSCKLTYRPS